MRSILTGIALAALVALAMPGAAQAHYYRHHHHASTWWCCCCCYYPVWHRHHWRGHHGWRHHRWHGWYGSSEPYGWGPAHAATDFMASGLNRGQLG
jgi:hypothetical protein